MTNLIEGHDNKYNDLDYYIKRQLKKFILIDDYFDANLPNNIISLMEDNNNIKNITLNGDLKKQATKTDIVDLFYTVTNLYQSDLNDAASAAFSARYIIRKYIETNELRDKILINKIITMNNILGIEMTNLTIALVFDYRDFHIIKSILVFLNIYDNKFGVNVECDIHMLNLFNDIILRHKNSN